MWFRTSGWGLTLSSFFRHMLDQTSISASAQGKSPGGAAKKSHRSYPAFPFMFWCVKSLSALCVCMSVLLFFIQPLFSPYSMKAITLSGCETFALANQTPALLQTSAVRLFTAPVKSKSLNQRNPGGETGEANALRVSQMQTNSFYLAVFWSACFVEGN